eukprot:scaffold591_cov69-Skeletonema_dohrnii-CCMP3373.AAC.2
MTSTSTSDTVIIFTVPTKQHDGGSVDKPTYANDAVPKPRVDAFAKYSSNIIRMKELLLLKDSNEHDEKDALDYLASLNNALRYASKSKSDQVDRNNHGNVSTSKRRKGNNSRRITQAQQGQGFLERKTRITYELHPSLLLHDLMDLDPDVSAHISDDEKEDEDDEPEE